MPSIAVSIWKNLINSINQKILKYNNMKKWDVCLMNPPYGSKTTEKNNRIDRSVIYRY